MTLISTPDWRRCMAVVCRMGCDTLLFQGRALYFSRLFCDPKPVFYSMAGHGFAPDAGKERISRIGPIGIDRDLTLRQSLSGPSPASLPEGHGSNISILKRFLKLGLQFGGQWSSFQFPSYPHKFRVSWLPGRSVRWDSH